MAQVFFESGFTDPEPFFSRNFFVDISKNTEEYNWIEMRRWMEKECEESVYIKTRFYNGKESTIRFFFGCESDAMAFKLRWL